MYSANCAVCKSKQNELIEKQEAQWLLSMVGKIIYLFLM